MRFSDETLGLAMSNQKSTKKRALETHELNTRARHPSPQKDYSLIGNKVTMPANPSNATEILEELNMLQLWIRHYVKIKQQKTIPEKTPN